MPHLGEQINQEKASSPTNSSTLSFVNAPYSPDELAQLLRDFRTNGYCILPDVFTIPTVAPFRRRVLAAATAGSYQAPRLNLSSQSGPHAYGAC